MGRASRNHILMSASKVMAICEILNKSLCVSQLPLLVNTSISDVLLLILNEIKHTWHFERNKAYTLYLSWITYFMISAGRASDKAPMWSIFHEKSKSWGLVPTFIRGRCRRGRRSAGNGNRTKWNKIAKKIKDSSYMSLLNITLDYTSIFYVKIKWIFKGTFLP